MSLYRQTGERNSGALIVAVAIGLLIGGLTGLFAGRGSVSQPSLAEQVADARAKLEPVAAGLELVPVEYGGSVRNGRVVSPTEYEASQAAVARAQQDLTAAGADLRVIDPAGYAAALKSIRALSDAVDAKVVAARVDSLARAARARVGVLAGG